MLKKINRSIDHFIEKNLFVSIVSKILGLLGLYALLQSTFDFPNIIDSIRYMTCSSWSTEILPFTLKGSVQLLSSSDSKDSLVAWSDAEAFLLVKISNKVANKLRIDSVRIYSGDQNISIESALGVDKGNLNIYRDAYILEGKEDVDLRLIPREIKGNDNLMQSIIKGKQSVIIFTERGRCARQVKFFQIFDKNEHLLRAITMPR